MDARLAGMTYFFDNLVRGNDVQGGYSARRAVLRQLVRGNDVASLDFCDRQFGRPVDLSDGQGQTYLLPALSLRSISSILAVRV